MGEKLKICCLLAGGIVCRPMLGLTALILITTDPSAQAQVRVSVNAAPPADRVLADFIPASSSGYQWRNNETGRRDLGQSFRASSNAVLGSFSIATAGNIQPGASRAPFTVKIFESTSDTVIGSVISTQTGIFLRTAGNPVHPGWITFDIEAVPLTAGKYYTFLLSWDRDGIARQDQLFLHSGEGYSNGRLWQANNGAAPSSSSGNDLVFSAGEAPDQTFSAYLPHKARFIAVSGNEPPSAWFTVSNRSETVQSAEIDVSLETPDRRTVVWRTSVQGIGAGEERQSVIPADHLTSYGIYRVRFSSARDGSSSEEDLFCVYPRNAQPGKGESVMPIGFATGAPRCTPWFLELAASLGLEFYRFNASWEGVQPSPSAWNWGSMDSYLDLMKQYGFRWHAMTTWSASWAAPIRSDPPEPSAWSAWISALASRYKEQIEFLEVWNEPNIGFFTGTVEDYTEVQRIAYDAAKAADPDLIVTSGGYAGINHWSSKPGAFEAAMLDYPRSFDWFAYHMHDVFPQFYSDLRYQLAALQQKAGAMDMPYVFTETGMDTRHGERFQAETLMKKMTYAAAIGAKSYCWYNLIDRTGRDAPNKAGVSFGLITNPTGTDNFASIESEVRPKESFVSAATAIHQLRRLPPLDIWAEGGGEYAFLFGTPGDHLLVGWRENPRTPTPIRVVQTPGSNVTRLDLFGNPETIPVVDGNVLIVMDVPQYVLFQGGNLSPQEMPPLVTAPQQVSPGADNQIVVGLDVRNPLDREVTVTVQARSGDDLSVLSSAETRAIPAGGTETFSIHAAVVVPGSLGQMTSFHVTFSFEGTSWEPVMEIPVLFNVIDAVKGAQMKLDSLHYVTNKQDHDPNTLHLLWGSPLDLSVQANFSVNNLNETAALKFTVTDNELYASASGEPVLDGDALEVIWIAGGETNHLAVAAETGNVPRSEFFRNGISVPPSEDIYLVTVTRSGTQTVYNLALKRTAMGAGDTALFNFAIHDNDGEGPESWIAAAPGAGGTEITCTDGFYQLKFK